jgi:hypothetical protein
LSSKDFYQNYLRAGEAVKAMKALPSELCPEPARPCSDGNGGKFAYLQDASQTIIRALRRHYHELTTAASYRYDDEVNERSLFENKLKALSALDISDLFVPESRALGGFGYELSRGLANLETLKVYECALALDRGGGLAALRRLPERQIVLELGPGWGGFSYALKTLFPNTCFVLCDFPDRLLFSATFLPTVFPTAKTALLTSEASELDDAWDAYDFIFVPHALYRKIKPNRVDLMVDSGSSPVSAELLRAYLRLAASLGCPIAYSLAPGTAIEWNDAFEEFYWVSEVPMLLVPHTRLIESKEAADVQAIASRWRKAKDELASTEGPLEEGGNEPASTEFRHLIGWKRLD